MEYYKKIEQEEQYDVVVVGGGPAGICAAVSSARQKADTLLIERLGVVGGMMTAGHVDPILGAVSEGTMYDEVVTLLARNHPESVPKVTRNGREIPVDPEEAKTLLADLVHDSGARLYLQTSVIDVIKDGSRVEGVILTTPRGLMAVRAKCVIDATGDGYVAAMAGAKFHVGRESDGHCQPCTLEFVIDQVDESRALTCFGGSDPVCLPDGRGYVKLCNEANERGELPENVAVVRLHKTHYPGRGVSMPPRPTGLIPSLWRESLRQPISCGVRHVPSSSFCERTCPATRTAVSSRRQMCWGFGRPEGSAASTLFRTGMWSMEPVLRMWWSTRPGSSSISTTR